MLIKVLRLLNLIVDRVVNPATCYKRVQLAEQEVDSVSPGQNAIVGRPVVSELLTKRQIITVLEPVPVSFIIDIKCFLSIQEVSDMVTSTFVICHLLSICSLTIVDLGLSSGDCQVKLCDLFFKNGFILLLCVLGRVLNFLEMAQSTRQLTFLVQALRSNARHIVVA